MKGKFRFVAVATMALGMLGLVSPGGQALAATTVTSPVTASVSSDSATGSSVVLPVLIITEGVAGDIPVGTLTWALPAGFVFDTSAVADVTFSGTGLAGASTVSFPDTTHFSVSVTSSSTAAGTLTVGATTRLKVKAANGTPLASNGNVILSAGSLAGLSSTTPFGTLSQVAGAANKLIFTTQPPTTVTVNTGFGATVAVQDQFGNTVTSDNGRSIVLSVVPVNPTTTTGTLSGTATLSSNAGIVNFSALSFSQAGTIKLQASSSPLTAALSNQITVTTSSTTTTTPTSTIVRILPNGILVKIASSSTVYMVVNNTLRPFTTPAIFHAKGKKFTSIVIITEETFAKLAIGKPVGQGSDDDDTIVTPPTASSTVPSLSNLPEGTLIKVPGNPTIYIVTGGVLKPFASMKVLQTYKKDLKKMKEVTSSELSTLPVGSPATYADGTLVKGQGPTIYVVKKGKKYGITSMAALKNKGLSLQNLMQLMQQEMDGMETGGIEE